MYPFLPSIQQEVNKSNTLTTSKGPCAMLTVPLRMEHCPVRVSQLPPLKPPAEELLPLPLSCSKSFFLLKHNSASPPHCNGLFNLRIKKFTVHQWAGSVDTPMPPQAYDDTQCPSVQPDLCHSDLQANTNVSNH